MVQGSSLSPSHFPKKHKNFLINALDGTIYAVSLIAPIVTIPQVFQVWRFHQTGGVSLISWTSYALINLLWITYGIAHKARPVTFGNLLMLFLNGAVALGVVFNK